MDTLTCSLYRLTTFTSLYPFHFIVSMFSPLSFYMISRSISFFPTQIGDLSFYCMGVCHVIPSLISSTFIQRLLVERLMSFHWSCFIVPLCLEIYSFIVILVCLSLFHSVYAQKKKQKNKKTKKQNKKKNKTKTKKNKRKRKKKKIYIYK